MILKCNYEKAWKELKECFNEMAKSENRKHQEYNVFGLNYFNIMNSFEQKHTNIIDIRRRSNEEVAGLCMRKYMEIYAKYINLKDELEKLCKKSRKDIKEIHEFKFKLNHDYQSKKKGD